MAKTKSTTNRYLADFFEINHRYTRSVNLERDMANIECLDDYIITERAAHCFGRIVSGMSDNRSLFWVLTGVYGTGKSAFAHFLASIFAPETTPIREVARKKLSKAAADGQLLGSEIECLREGVLLAPVTAELEPISKTLLRAIWNALDTYKGRDKKRKDSLLREVIRVNDKLGSGKEVSSSEILRIVRNVSDFGGAGLFILIDEMGRSLEYTVQNQSAGDLYLLQQLQELPQNCRSPIYLLGILHHSFSEYGINLSAADRNKWLKIQGRFEEMSFAESTTQMIQLIAEVIQKRPNIRQKLSLRRQSVSWSRQIPEQLSERLVSAEMLENLFPLHPMTALVLPQLFNRYAQNDRSLFSFLTSYEPNSFRIFLEETKIENDTLPLFRIARLYDYFTETSLSNLVLKPNFQRWAEVKHLIDEHENDDSDTVLLLKTIGILNLIGSAGSIRATREIVIYSLCGSVYDKADFAKWSIAIEKLIARGVLAYRRQIDELRLWEGSDFDFDRTVAQSREKLRLTLADLLERSHPAGTVVAQRHSYETGAVRYFDSAYVDDAGQLEALTCKSSGSSGLIGYWVAEAPPHKAPALTSDGKPFMLIHAKHVGPLRSNATEYAAIEDIMKESNELATDGVARRELRHRMVHAKNLLDDSFAKSFDQKGHLDAWIGGKRTALNPQNTLNAQLSKLCDRIFKHRVKLWNELINRQELTSQGARARKQVIAAMIETGDKEGLGLTGNGPEVSIYQSVLNQTGIHRFNGVGYEFGRPSDPGFAMVWDEIEKYCLDSIEKTRKLDGIFNALQQPPFGVKAGLIPILFAAVIISRSDDIGIYRDDIFIAQLGPEHFELLVKDASRFSVKHFKVAGVRADVFREVETILLKGINLPDTIRNRSILNVVAPLLRFARKLPRYSQNTDKLSNTALDVRRVLLQAPEPDHLLFELLPQACGFSPFMPDSQVDANLPREFRSKLSLALKEIREAYEVLLNTCRTYLYEAFGVKQDVSKLREDLRARASYLKGRSIEPVLSRFIFAATEIGNSDEDWLEALFMVIADKPVESWTDSDAELFELTLADISRRFKQLEAIYRSNASMWSGAAEAKRISIVRTDGKELHDIAWIDENQRNLIERKATHLLDKMPDDKLQQKAVLATLVERILTSNTGVFSKTEQKEEDKDAPRIRAVRRKR